MLLLALHVLFGVTGIMAMLVAHTRLKSTIDTPYYSHLHWQIVTFWVALSGYVVAVWVWNQTSLLWPVWLVTGFVTYRLLVNLHHWLASLAITRTI